jgi:hypothetical protein
MTAFLFHVITGKHDQHDNDRKCHDDDEDVREIIEILVDDGDAPDIIPEYQESPAPDYRTDEIEYNLSAVIHYVHPRNK